ncbi:MAG: hypothetical protein JSR19_11580 [Proteobacteria bacterium]|nr:hypothetical protein [Pseudomonadota bacterium]HQR02682.1 hypothetical protein [Rhodocyclaceae bacterium]
MTQPLSADFGTLPEDALANVASPEIQCFAARMAREAFALVFRFSVNGESDGETIAEMKQRIVNWSRAGADDGARALRLSMVVSGLDQWGLAYAQAFDLAAIPALSELLGALRSDLDARDDARFQQAFGALEKGETDAVDFKVELRRGIHMSLWHAMAASPSRDHALALAGCLGGMLLAQVETLPHLGWRLVADTLAHVQIRCLGDDTGLASAEIAREANQALFDSLRQAMPVTIGDRIMAHATRAVLAWRQSRRPAH